MYVFIISVYCSSFGARFRRLDDGAPDAAISELVGAIRLLQILPWGEVRFLHVNTRQFTFSWTGRHPSSPTPLRHCVRECVSRLCLRACVSGCGCLVERNILLISEVECNLHFISLVIGDLLLPRARPRPGPRWPAAPVLPARRRPR